MLESALKKTCKKKLEASGWMVIHLIQTNQNGIPDTLILHPVKGLAFIEFKRPGRRTKNKSAEDIPEELQKYRIRKLREAGARVLIVDREADILELL